MDILSKLKAKKGEATSPPAPAPVASGLSFKKPPQFQNISYATPEETPHANLKNALPTPDTTADIDSPPYGLRRIRCGVTVRCAHRYQTWEASFAAECDVETHDVMVTDQLARWVRGQVMQQLADIGDASLPYRQKQEER